MKRFLVYSASLLVVLTVLFAAIRLYIAYEKTKFEYFEMTNNFMEPTLKEKSVIQFLKISEKKKGAIQRGTIILHKNPIPAGSNDAVTDFYNHTLSVSRVIGLPGETIEIRDGKIFINDAPISEAYARESKNFQSYKLDPTLIPLESFFVFKDNRDDYSAIRAGSQTVGFIPSDLIIGVFQKCSTNCF